MKRASAAQARQHLSDLLDAAERGEAVVIERRGVRYRLQVLQPPKRSRGRRSLIARMDAAVEAGAWSWTPDDAGLRFTKGHR